MNKYLENTRLMKFTRVLGTNLWRLARYVEPKNGFTVEQIRFCPNFRAIQVSWTANAAMSEGAEQFVDEFLPIIQ